MHSATAELSACTFQLANSYKSSLSALFLVMNQKLIFGVAFLFFFGVAFQYVYSKMVLRLISNWTSILISFKPFSYKETKFKILKAKTKPLFTGLDFQTTAVVFWLNSYLCMIRIIFISTYFPFDLEVSFQ